MFTYSNTTRFRCQMIMWGIQHNHPQLINTANAAAMRAFLLNPIELLLPLFILFVPMPDQQPSKPEEHHRRASTSEYQQLHGHSLSPLILRNDGPDSNYVGCSHEQCGQPHHLVRGTHELHHRPPRDGDDAHQHVHHAHGQEQHSYVADHEHQQELRLTSLNPIPSINSNHP